MKHHVLKITEEMFIQVKTGMKTFEARKDDRGFKTGDYITLQMIDEFGRDHPNVYTDHEKYPKIQANIGYVLPGDQYGIEPGYVVFSLLNVK